MPSIHTLLLSHVPAKNIQIVFLSEIISKRILTSRIQYIAILAALLKEILRRNYQNTHKLFKGIIT